ncbi:purine-nucleoside phosphorylase [uncultured Erythrobacter sp.]|uniref:purine-nucleoside phosphorylase n=1 Tax=uncultured Erythrobacter sp. TaxID=263913 RepID=UPI00261566FF|nr:purine-nucleoside phosphorylase [uncultured Erythrobacter sp.]
MVKALGQRLDEAAAFVRGRTSHVPEVALVLGSGLGDLADAINGTAIAYSAIPHFPDSTAPSHKGVLHIGELAGVSVVAMQGRMHLYEGYSPQDVVFPMQVMARLGAKTALLTNAAGGIREDLSVTDLVLIEDHLSLANLAGNDPLRGPNDESVGERFVSMNNAYDRNLRAKAQAVAAKTGLDLQSGVYGFVTGPSFETPAEIRALRTLGCDLVGMSTVPEVIAARHSGMEVLAIGTITNKAVSSLDDDHITNAEEVWEAADLIRPKLAEFVNALLPRLGGGAK